MKSSPEPRKFIMFLHLICIFVFSFPITTHILTIALNKEFRIQYYPFTEIDSYLLIGFLLLIISANIFSVITNKGHRISFLISGGFLYAVTAIQICAAYFNIKMYVFGELWQSPISTIELVLTGILSIVLFLYATVLKDEISSSSDAHDSSSNILGASKRFIESIEKMDKKLAFLFGIICSLFLTIPICGLLYLLANLLIDENLLDIKQIRLLAWIGIVGMQGSIISMLLGLRRFKDNNKNLDSLELFLNALVRPFIGFSFAHLTFFMLESGLLQDHQVGAKKINGMFFSFEYHVTFAFIAGFTERIAKVIQSDNFGKRTQITDGNDTVEKQKG